MSQIYEKPARLLMHDMVRDLGIKSGDVITKPQVRLWFKERYPKLKEGTIDRHFDRMSTNVPSRLNWSIVIGEDDLFFYSGNGRYRLYEPDIDSSPIYEQPIPADGEPLESSVHYEGDSQFAYEKDLQNYLARNLELIESGLVLYEQEGVNGIEFPAGKRYIDILAVDRDGNYVVVELKVSRGYDRVVGQTLRYMAWIRMKHADIGQTVRGIIVAREIDIDLQLATSETSSITLFEYEMSVKINPVTSQGD